MSRLNLMTFSISLLFIVPFFSFAQDLKINELMSSNSGTVHDEDQDTPDWIEIFNYGQQTIQLDNYFLSDDKSKPLKWQLPSGNLQPDAPLLIFASDKDRRSMPLFYYSLIEIGDTCSYIIPKSEIPASWRTAEFDANSWGRGPTGIGYGDDDDNTVIAKNTLSVFLRIEFSVKDKEAINNLWLHMDYDDGFIAYLNGTEIARAGLGVAGSAVAFNQSASSHEAKIYSGNKPEGFNVSEYIHLLSENENVLAVQVHNTSESSSDLSATPFLTVGYTSVETGLKSPSEYVNLSSPLSHTNFKLSSSGETVFLSHKTNGLVDSVSFGEIPAGYSYGRDAEQIQKWVFFEEPTPGEQNHSGSISEVIQDEVEFSIPEMFLSSPQELVLSSAEGDGQIHYTLNSSIPTIDSPVYKSPISIDKNTVVKAAVFKEGAVPGKTVTHTYLFDDQSTLPVVSVAADSSDLWDNETGIYVLGDNYEDEVPYMGANFWQDWEKQASIEMIEPSGQRAFSLNCGIKIFGGWSRANDQKSLAVFFRKEYGDAQLKNYKLFPSKPIEDFKSVVLRNSGNDYSFSKMRDAMMTTLVSNMNIDFQANRPSALYLNGQYWGLINIREKVNEDFLESNHGVSADSIDLLEWNGSAIEGSSDKYWQLINYLNSNSLKTDASYNVVEKQIDIENYIDYQLSQIYFDNRDWPGNNIKYWRPQTEDGKWRWIMFDTDFGFGIYNDKAYLDNTLQFALASNGPDWPNPPWSTFIFRKLFENEIFRNKFINRYADMLNTTFKPAHVIAVIDSMASVIEPEIPRQNERWGAPDVWFWQQNILNMRAFATYRVENVRKHIKQQFSIPEDHEITVSVLPSAGGFAALNSIVVKGTSWKGTYFEGVPIKLTANAYAGYKFNSWIVNGKIFNEETIELNIAKVSDIRLLFEDAGDDGNSVVFNEINYNSSVENDAGDWVELFNWGRNDLDISGWTFKDDDNLHQFVIPQNTILKSDEYLVLCRNEDNFILSHPDVQNYLAEFDFGLSSSGDQIRLFDNLGQLVDQVTFGTESPWPEEPNGTGMTLELRNYSNDNLLAESWKASLDIFGTPGRINSITTESKVVENINSLQTLKIYPNPFTNQTRIEVNIQNLKPVSVEIYSLQGKLVYMKKTPDNYIIWNGKTNEGQNLHAGVYVCKVKCGSEVLVSKLVLNPN